MHIYKKGKLEGIHQNVTCNYLLVVHLVYFYFIVDVIFQRLYDSSWGKVNKCLLTPDRAPNNRPKNDFSQVSCCEPMRFLGLLWRVGDSKAPGPCQQGQQVAKATSPVLRPPGGSCYFLSSQSLSVRSPFFPQRECFNWEETATRHQVIFIGFHNTQPFTRKDSDAMNPEHNLGQQILTTLYELDTGINWG